MPLYEYFCEQCLKRYEVLIKLADYDEEKDKIKCPHCEQPVIKLLSAPYFKISGGYDL